MCGRYVQTKRARDKAERWATPARPEAPPRPESWNVAPSTTSMVVRSAEAVLVTDWLSWGFQDGATALRPINARAETASTRYFFKAAWNLRRCVVPVDGWYEWRKEHSGNQPYYFRRADHQATYLAGLWTGNSFCLLTTAADGELALIHHRRPLAVRDEDAAAWISAEATGPDQVIARGMSAAEFTFHAVDPKVGDARNDGPDLIEPFPFAAGGMPLE